jgi:lysophospholipase
MFDPRSDPTALPAAIPAPLAASFAPGGYLAFLDAGDGARLRYGHWPAIAAKPRGKVVVLGGRGEFIEKYATEVVGELLGRGFEVFSMDWRGQGLSQRALAETEKGHIEDFAVYRDDLHRFLTVVVGASTDKSPVLLLAHSMGGLTTLRVLADRAAEKLVDRPQARTRHTRRFAAGSPQIPPRHRLCFGRGTLHRSAPDICGEPRDA